MNLSTRPLVALLGAAVLATVGLANAGSDQEPGESAQYGHGHGFGGGFMSMPGMMHPGAIARIADELGLTPEQRQTIRGLFAAARPQMQALRDEFRANAEKLLATKPDDANYGNVVTEVSQASGELASRLVTEGSQLRAQVYAVLTAEQKAKLPEVEAQMKERARERFERHHGPDGATKDSAPESP